MVKFIYHGILQFGKILFLKDISGKSELGPNATNRYVKFENYEKFISKESCLSDRIFKRRNDAIQVQLNLF